MRSTIATRSPGPMWWPEGKRSPQRAEIAKAVDEHALKTGWKPTCGRTLTIGLSPNGLVMDFQEHAQQQHQIRDTLVAAIAEHRAVDPADLASERLCPTGCWLRDDGPRRWAGNHAFLGLLEAHRTFHQQAEAVADLTRRSRWTDAQKALRNGSPFALALVDLTAALRAMRRAATSIAA